MLLVGASRIISRFNPDYFEAYFILLAKLLLEEQLKSCEKSRPRTFRELQTLSYGCLKNLCFNLRGPYEEKHL